MTIETNNYVFSITHFDSDPERVAVPLVLADNTLAMMNSRSLACNNSALINKTGTDFHPLRPCK